MRHATFFTLIILLLNGEAWAQSVASDLSFSEGLAVRIASGRGGRSPVHTDPVEARLVEGARVSPQAGETLTLADGTQRTWEKIKADKEGVLSHQALGGGYASWKVTLDRERLLILEATGPTLVYVNGVPRPGDVYSHGYVRLPVLLTQGENDLLFLVARGRLRARLTEPKASAFLDMADVTLPDFRVGEKLQARAAVVVVNATQAPLTNLTLEASLPGGLMEDNPVPTIPPLSVRKVGFTLPSWTASEPGPFDIGLQLRRGARVFDKTTLRGNVRRLEEPYRVTFVSNIDGSVQYYAVNPARPLSPKAAVPALILTLHGASVEASGQAAAYSAKPWGHLVAPTNRRPYGFDWEDWGRLDALEVLEQAQQRLGTDPQRTYLTGHSMGGHGTWHLGVTYPDRFAAIGPSAGWIRMGSYGGTAQGDRADPVQEMLMRAQSPSNTLSLAKNIASHGVYILHGDADDNVPVSQARQMRKELSAFASDLHYHEQLGAGHWWDASDEPGTDCVDWAPLFDVFSRRVLPTSDALRQVDFVTAHPGVSSRAHWVSVEAARVAMRPASVQLRRDPGQRRVVGKTENVARLALDLKALPEGGPLTVQLDGQKLEKIPRPTGEQLWLERQGEQWSVVNPPSAALKSPARCGPFKEAFRRRMLLVHGTLGTPKENAWSLARARLDAETFWYRGNGSLDVIPDTAFDPQAEPDRNVILYGNATINGAWKPLLGQSPIQVERTAVRLGHRQWEGEDLACLFVRPRPGSPVASVAAVSGTGLPGLRLTERLPYFSSGVAYPDCVVIRSTMLLKGAEGVLAAGFFGNDWGVESGEFAMRP